MILNQLQIFTEHSQTKRVTMRVNTSILEAQGARLIKNKCQTNLLTRGVFSFTTDLLSLEVFNPLLPQFEMKKTNRKKPQKTKTEIS